jgi:hypothetical protein
MYSTSYYGSIYLDGSREICVHMYSSYCTTRVIKSAVNPRVRRQRGAIKSLASIPAKLKPLNPALPSQSN